MSKALRCDVCRNTLKIVLVLALSAGCAERTEPPVAATPIPPTNVLLISLDACRADHLGCHGYGRDTSPFIDTLAAQGVRFANAFVNTHGTPPSPTTILTSLYQQTHPVGWQDAPQPELDRVPERTPMLQELLAQRGYVTVAVT